jgi:Ankyrin repeats (3 copies)
MKPGTVPLLMMLHPWKVVVEGLLDHIKFDSLHPSLYHLASHDCPQLLSFLIQRKMVEVNEMVEVWESALNALCAKGHESIVHVLLTAGADPLLGDEGCSCALEAAITGSEDGIARSLLERDDALALLARCEEFEYSPLVEASGKGLRSTVELLIQLGADNKDRRGMFALPEAAMGGHTHIIKLLLENNNDIDVRGRYCGNAAQAAAVYDRIAAMMLLLDYGAKVDLPGEEWEKLLSSLNKLYSEDITIISRLRELQRKFGEASRRGELKKYNLKAA